MLENLKDKKITLSCFIVTCLCLSAAVAFCFLVANEANSSEAKIDRALNPERDYLILVNQSHPYKFLGKYNQELQDDLIYAPGFYGEAVPVEKAAFVAFSELRHALERKGVLISLYGAYRTAKDQQSLYDYYSQFDTYKGRDSVLPSGYSEHHTGLLLSVLVWYQDKDDETPNWYIEVPEDQIEAAHFDLLHNMLADYGFVYRYPPGKEDVTGLVAHLNEIRFVGSSATAHMIMDNGITIEEYMDLPKGGLLSTDKN